VVLARDVVSILRFFWRRPHLLTLVVRYEQRPTRSAGERRRRVMRAVERVLARHRIRRQREPPSGGRLPARARARRIFEHAPEDRPEAIRARVVHLYLHGSAPALLAGSEGGGMRSAMALVLLLAAAAGCGGRSRRAGGGAGKPEADHGDGSPSRRALGRAHGLGWSARSPPTRRPRWRARWKGKVAATLPIWATACGEPRARPVRRDEIEARLREAEASLAKAAGDAGAPSRCAPAASSRRRSTSRCAWQIRRRADRPWRPETESSIQLPAYD